MACSRDETVLDAEGTRFEGVGAFFQLVNGIVNLGCQGFAESGEAFADGFADVFGSIGQHLVECLCTDRKIGDQFHAAFGQAVVDMEKALIERPLQIEACLGDLRLEFVGTAYQSIVQLLGNFRALFFDACCSSVNQRCKCIAGCADLVGQRCCVIGKYSR